VPGGEIELGGGPRRFHSAARAHGSADEEKTSRGGGKGVWRERKHEGFKWREKKGGSERDKSLWKSMQIFTERTARRITWLDPHATPQEASLGIRQR